MAEISDGPYMEYMEPPAFDPENMKDLVDRFREQLKVIAPPGPAPMVFDLKSISVVLFTAAMCVGKPLDQIDSAWTARLAFSLANMLFKPNGDLND
jgi:hypothetical protein